MRKAKIGKYTYKIDNDLIYVLSGDLWVLIPKDYSKYNLLLNDIIKNTKAFNSGTSKRWEFKNKSNISSINLSKNVLPNGIYQSNNAELLKQFTNSLAKKALGLETYDDVKGIVTDPNLSILDKLSMFYYGYKRKFDPDYEGEDLQNKKRNTEIILDYLEPVIESNVFNELLKKASYNISNDTTFFNDNRKARLFSVPRSINLSGVKLGSRNRGNRTPFTARDVIGTYKPIISYESGINNGTFRLYDTSGNINEFLGYDSEGNFKIGTIDKFGPGDMMSQVYYDYIRDIPREQNGNPYLVRAIKDSRRLSPQVVGYGEDNINYNNSENLRKFPLLLMTPKKNWRDRNHNLGLDLFNNISGGGYILNVDDEYRLVRGSTNNVLDEILKMKTNHKGNKDVKIYQIDNGSYNRGMMTRDNIYTADDLRIYDAQDSGQGHFFYIKPERFPILKNGGKLVSAIVRFKNKKSK